MRPGNNEARRVACAFIDQYADEFGRGAGVQNRRIIIRYLPKIRSDDWVNLIYDSYRMCVYTSEQTARGRRGRKSR